MRRKGRKADGGALPLAGLRFAVYARKSNEDARTEDHKSTARQVEQSRRFVEARGGEVLPEQIYTDEATSGAEFQDRPGLLRFLNVLENGRPFNALWEGTLLDKYYFARRPSHSKRRKARNGSPGLMLRRTGRSGTALSPLG